MTLARDLQVSEKRLLGWEPAERHEHFDADGNLTGWTVVTREAEWDDAQRNSMLALVEYEAGVCSCGFHRSLTMNPDLGFTTQSEVCPVCAGAAVSDRIRRKRDEETDRILKDRPHEPRPSDGLHVFIRQLSDDELEKRRTRRATRSQPDRGGA